MNALTAIRPALTYPPHPEESYLSLLRELLVSGERREDRTGVGTLGLFGRQIRFNLAEGFPLLTTKRLPFKSVVGELLWILSGSTNAHDLRKRFNCTIWDEWAGEDGELGPVYGKQWRKWAAPEGLEIDQIQRVIGSIRENPTSRRHIVSAWNPAEVDEMALPPCHCFFQFHVANGRLSCQLYQRSADVFLGVPFNIASYSLLTMMVAQLTDLEIGEFVHTFGDLHLYLNHIEQAETQVSREPRPFPTVQIDRRESIDEFELGDFNLFDYCPHERLPAPVAV